MKKGGLAVLQIGHKYSSGCTLQGFIFTLSVTRYRRRGLREGYCRKVEWLAMRKQASRTPSRHIIKEKITSARHVREASYIAGQRAPPDSRERNIYISLIWPQTRIWHGSTPTFSCIVLVFLLNAPLLAGVFSGHFTATALRRSFRPVC